MNQPLQLLQQIADNTANDNAIWIASISGGAALLGASIGAVVSYFTAKSHAKSQYQIEMARLRANVVTTERLRWLQDIRQRFSSLYVTMDMQFNYLKRPAESQNRDAMQKQLDAFSEKVMEESNVITLMLNPEKKEQRELRQALQESLNFLLQCFSQRNQGQSSFDDSRYQKLKQLAFDRLTSIGADAWKRIKELQ